MSVALTILKGILDFIVISIKDFVFWVQNVAWAIGQLAIGLRTAKAEWAEFVSGIEKSTGIELPSWMKPGSPPPIANALNDTADALQRMNQAGGLNLGNGLRNAAGAAGQSTDNAVAAATGGGGSIMQTIQLVVDGRVLAEVVNSGLGLEMKNTNALTA